MVINVFNLSYEEVRVRVMKEDVDFEVKRFLYSFWINTILFWSFILIKSLSVQFGV